MALSPLIVQRPSVSLIGGKELPKASGEGINVPDLGQAFSGITTALRQKELQNRAIDDELAAKLDVEAWHGQTQGKSPLDRYTNPPKVNGSPIYRASVSAAIENNAIADIRSIYSTQAGSIQVKTGISTDEKLAQIAAAAEGVIGTIAPEYRQAAREYVQRDISEREAQLRGEDARRLEIAVEDGQRRRLTDAFDKGISAASAGADWTEYSAEIRKVLDEKVLSGDMLPEIAQSEGQRLSNLMVAEGIHRTVAVEAAKGNISPAELLEFGVGVDTGVPVELFTDVPNPDTLAVLRYDTGQSKKDPYKNRIISADEYKELIGDPVASKAIANNMQELARYLGAKVKDNEEAIQFRDFVRKNAINPTATLPETLKSYAEKVAAHAIHQQNALNTPEGREVLKALVRGTNYMPKEMLSQLQAMVQGTYEESIGAINLYNELTTGIVGSVESGKIIQQSIPADVAARFDSLTLHAGDLLRQHGDDKKSIEQDWRRSLNKLADKANNEEFFADGYYTATKQWGAGESLNSAIQRKSREHYGRTTLDADILREARAAYRNSMILSDSVGEIEALDAVMERIFNRYTRNPIFSTGVARVEAWENPEIEGYISPKFTDPTTWNNERVNPNQWTSDFVTGQLNNYLGRNQVLMTPNGMKALNQALAVGPGTPLGETLLLEQIGGNFARPQFKVLVVMENGTSTEIVNVLDENGRQTPLLLDPGLLLSNINNRNREGQTQYQSYQDYIAGRNTRIIEQITRTTNAENTGSEISRILDDPAVYEKWFVSQDQKWQKEFNEWDINNQQMLKQSMKRYEELQNTVVPEGMEVDPKLLGTPKAVGKGVVLGAIDAVSKVFADNQTMKQFMANVSSAESNFGAAENTFRLSGDRGLWQINDSGSGALMEVKRRAAIPGDPMYAMAQKAKQMLSIDVASLTSSDLDKALPSALVARMYFSRTQAPVPDDPEDQAEYWREHYNPGATDSMVANFVSAAGSLIVPAAYASTGLEAGGPGMVTDVRGNAHPANFTATAPATQTSALRLSAAFGQPLRVTPHGGRRRGGSKTSQHYHGTAIDIYIADMPEKDRTRLIALAISMGYRGIGGYGAGSGKGTIHLDLRTYGKHGGLALWWRNKPGVDDDWTTGQKWFTNGIKQGSAMKGINPGG